MNQNIKLQFINSRTIAQTQEENQACEQIILRAINEKVTTKKQLHNIHKQVCEEFGIDFLTQPMLLNMYKKLTMPTFKEKASSASSTYLPRRQAGVVKANPHLFELLRKRRIRTSSGIAPVAILTKPFPCPGKCIYCPSEPNMPKSYISNEPAVMRAILADFDPARQIEIRLRGLEIAGNPADKIELIVMGGTWSYLPRDYQLKYIIECYRACNDFNKKIKYQKSNIKMTNKYLKNKDLVNEQEKNEKAKYRIIGLTLETRPDFINEDEIKWMRTLGCTRVEIGVQSIYDRVLDINKRGHKVAQTIKATKLLKNAGFKVCYHMMPNLYGSNKKLDLIMFKELFSNPDFQPDMIKIYNCVVTKYSKLEKLAELHKFIPYTDEELIKLMVDIKKHIPQYVRILRLGRDIPADNIIYGSKISNIRQIVQEQLQKLKIKCQNVNLKINKLNKNYKNKSLTENCELKIDNYICKCIRCREIREDAKLPVKLNRINYEASDGKEVFLQYVDKNNRLYALLRLRIPSDLSSKSNIKSFNNCGIIREVHTYGPMVRIGDNKINAHQHQGLGKKLIIEAERITKYEFGLSNIAVISGVGARGYYFSLGYRLNNTYMIKEL